MDKKILADYIDAMELIISVYHQNICSFLLRKIHIFPCLVCRIDAIIYRGRQIFHLCFCVCPEDHLFIVFVAIPFPNLLWIQAFIIDFLFIRLHPV